MPQHITTPRNKTERAYDYIRRQIQTRTYAPGARLVLAEIAEANGMSIVPVREAIRLLEAEGLVTVERNVGAHVTFVDDHEYIQAMQVLAIVEGAATALSAPHATPSQLADALAVNAEIKALLDDFDPARAAELNHRFHDILTQNCRNTDLSAIAANQWTRLAGVRDESCSFTLAGARQTVHEHDRLVELVRAGADPYEIEKAIREHRLRASAAFLTGRHHDRDGSRERHGGAQAT
jgi:DNA-binding GntR family transcriptional regulator